MNHRGSYLSLALMAALSFLAMYVLMYAMVNSFGNVFGNLNQLYMAALMTAAMVMIELLVMRRMYPDTLTNIGILSGAIIVFLACWFFIRGQLAIGDKQFLASMIPHHGAAILMCVRAQLEEPAIQALCKRIVENQQTEIDWMQSKLEMLEEE